MADEPLIGQEKPEVPYVTVTGSGVFSVSIATNLPPEGRSLLLWLLEQAKLKVLMSPSDQEVPKVMKAPPGGLLGLKQRLGRNGH